MTYPCISGNIRAVPRILGIDSSLTCTGLARIDTYLNADGNQWSSVYDHWDIDTATASAPKPGKDKSKRAMIRRVNALMSQIEGAIIDAEDISNGFKPDLIVIESLAYGAKGASVWVLAYVFGKCIELAERYDVQVIEVATTQIKKYVTGTGNADKDIVLAAAIKRWPEANIQNNNVADAMGAAAIGCHWLGCPIVQTAQYHTDVMDAVKKYQEKINA